MKLVSMEDMTYRSRVTSKGTATIPAAIRKQLRLKPGMVVTFIPTNQPDEVIVKRTLTIEELRVQNKASLKRLGTWNKPYYSGAGFEAHVMEKYGKAKRRS